LKKIKKEAENKDLKKGIEQGCEVEIDSNKTS